MNSNCMNTLIDPFIGCNNKPVPTENLKQWLSAYEKKEQYEYCQLILEEIQRRETIKNEKK